MVLMDQQARAYQPDFPPPPPATTIPSTSAGTPLVPPAPPPKAKAPAPFNPGLYARGAQPVLPPAQAVQWAQTDFVRSNLPDRAVRMNAAFGGAFAKQTNLRSALQCCYGPLFEHLPLLLTDIVTPSCDLGLLAAPRESVVVAEKVPRVLDINRPGQCRVDFFVYEAGGEVVRHHPGGSRKLDMTPHRMRNGSSVFLVAAAVADGVGAALHRMPPAWAEQLNSLSPVPTFRPAVTRVNMADIAVYDFQQCNWKRIASMLSQVEDAKCPLNFTDGEIFPWWVWLANTGQLAMVSGTGINEIWLVVYQRQKLVLIDAETGYYQMTKKGKVDEIREYTYNALKQ